ncbi:MAG: EpsI family protein [candidate division Zixibacteria bacterium]|nr:EpsI family protein [candidate division Zixibacteria bacterium]
MARKTFITFFTVLMAVFVFTTILRYFKPDSSHPADFERFPMRAGNWIGENDVVPDFLVDALKPDNIFSATFTSRNGQQIQLFFDYFAGKNSARGVHSPRNCMPGSGWAIINTTENTINLGNRVIPASRFVIQNAQNRQCMDFWYVTRYGDTSNDYVFKFYLMLSSFTFRPNDVAFIRIIGIDTPDGRKALDDFERQFIGEIYKSLPF